MRISVTVPSTQVDVSNGTFPGKTWLPNDCIRYDWYVHYPINTYDVVILGTMFTFQKHILVEFN